MYTKLVNKIEEASKKMQDSVKEDALQNPISIAIEQWSKGYITGIKSFEKTIKAILLQSVTEDKFVLNSVTATNSSQTEIEPAFVQEKCPSCDSMLVKDCKRSGEITAYTPNVTVFHCPYCDYTLQKYEKI